MFGIGPPGPKLLQIPPSGPKPCLPKGYHIHTAQQGKGTDDHLLPLGEWFCVDLNVVRSFVRTAHSFGCSLALLLFFKLRGKIFESAREEAAESAFDEAVESAPDAAGKLAPQEGSESMPEKADESAPDEASESMADDTGESETNSLWVGII